MGKAKTFEPKAKVVDDCRYLELGELWKKAGKPPGFEPRPWTSPDSPNQKFWMLIGAEGYYSDDVLIDEGEAGLWAIDNVALDYALFMVADGSVKPGQAFVDWVNAACVERDDASVRMRMKCLGETEAEARTFLRRYC